MSETQYLSVEQAGALVLLLEDGNVRVQPLGEREEWLIGRFDPNAESVPDIQFTSRIVSRRHGSFRCAGDCWYYSENPENLNGTFFNGKKIKKARIRHPKLLDDGDLLRIDYEDLNRPAANGVLMLFTTREIGGEWKKATLPKDAPFTIGRDPSCSLQETDPAISAHHAKITWQDGRFLIEDCGSKGGTFVNGVQLLQAAALREKDCIMLGGQVYFMLGDQLLYSTAAVN